MAKGLSRDGRGLTSMGAGRAPVAHIPRSKTFSPKAFESPAVGKIGLGGQLPVHPAPSVTLGGLGAPRKKGINPAFGY